MIVQFTDSVTGMAVYSNPSDVVALRPDPAEPTRVTMVKHRDWEMIRVHGEYRQVADKLTRAAA